MYRYGQCKAKAKSTGERCKNDSEPGFSVCRIHGGLTPTGEDSPHYIHGRRASRRHKHLPKRMIEAYENSVTDPELLSLREEIALVDSRINDLLSRAETGESGAIWKRIAEVYEDFYEAHVSKNGTKMALYLMQMGDLIQRGAGDFAIWDELSGMLEQRRRLTDSDARRLKDMQAMISAQEAMELMGEVVLILRKHVTESVILEAIYRDITGLFAEADASQISNRTGTDS